MTLNQAVRLLEEAGIDSPREDAIALFCHFLKKTQIELLLEKCDYDDEALLVAVQRRSKREPLQYIIGSVCFYREDYEVTSDCLIPRSDTEILVDYAVKSIPEGEAFLDLCTGSGCVAISTLKNAKNTRAIAVDVSKKALEIAKKNAKLNSVEERLTLLERDVLCEDAIGEFYAVLSNPPYVSVSEYQTLAPEIYFEPKIAFVGGEDGLNFYRTITRKYRNHLKKGGFIAYEIGYNQANDLIKIAEELSMRCEIIKDYSGNDRVAVLKPKD